jgi:hypothetical protein
MINMQNVVVVVGGGFVVVVVGGGAVVVVVGGFVVVVVGVGFVVVVVEGGFVVVVVVGAAVVDVALEVVVVDDCVAGGDVVEVALDTVDVVVGERVVVVPETDVADADEEEAMVVVGSATTLGSCTREAAWELTGRSGWACIKVSPPAAVVPSATDPAINAAWDPTTATLPRLLNWLTIGTSNSQASGPTTRRWRPTEMLRNARTMAGSNWVPAQRVSSLRASQGDIGLLYERAAVITSKESATATMRAPREI